jgi:hypothetical protein
MEIVWTVVSFAFTFGVLALVAYALVHAATAGRHHVH